MKRIVSCLAAFLVTAGVLMFLQVAAVNAQVIETLETSSLLPAHLKGFEVDPPMVVVKETRNEEYISVSRMFYRPQTGETLTLTFKDYSVNPETYQKQLTRLKKLKKDDNNTSVSRYKGNLMNRERRENYIEKGIYLGQNKAVEVVHEGAISDTTLSTVLLNRLDLELIKAKL